MHARDAEALPALYHPHVTVYDMWEHWQYDGQQAWRGMVEGWFASLGDERVQVTFDDVCSTVTPELALLPSSPAQASAPAANACAP